MFDLGGSTPQKTHYRKAILNVLNIQRRSMMIGLPLGRLVFSLEDSQGFLSV